MSRTLLAIFLCLPLGGLVRAERPADVAIEKDIVYGKSGGVELKLDLARPAKGKGPFPLVVCIHGGAWQAGHRSAHHRTMKLLARNGYVAASIGYRLAPKHRWPAQIEDCKCAVRYLRAKAKELAIDPTKVGAVGDSAGGHLSLLLGLMDAKDGLEGDGGNTKQASKVQAVVNYYGPTDLRTWAPTAAGEKALRAWTKGKKGGDDLLKDLAGTADRKAPVMAQLSPITYIDAKDAPVLTVQGTEDPLVQLSQATALHQALRKAGVPEKLEVLKGKGHGWAGEDRDRTDRLMIQWFDKYLKGKSERAPGRSES
jgi:acetyl esterase/lipase